MTGNCHTHRLQTNSRHTDETQFADRHNIIKVKKPALCSSTRRLLTRKHTNNHTTEQGQKNHIRWHSRKSATIRESNHGSSVCKEHYA